MEWLFVMSFFISITVLIIWFRAETKSNWHHMNTKLDAHMKSSQKEMKDFHGRLCPIEEKRRGL
jgi:hypothetical protein